MKGFEFYLLQWQVQKMLTYDICDLLFISEVRDILKFYE